jgi:hypothetical protein
MIASAGVPLCADAQNDRLVASLRLASQVRSRHV